MDLLETRTEVPEQRGARRDCPAEVRAVPFSVFKFPHNAAPHRPPGHQRVLISDTLTAFLHVYFGTVCDEMKPPVESLRGQGSKRSLDADDIHRRESLSPADSRKKR